MTKLTKQMVVVEQLDIHEHQQVETVALFFPDGTPYTASESSEGSSFPNFSGSGSPEGVQTATVGKSYVDTTNGALYEKGTGSGNTGWVAVGGVLPGIGNGIAGLAPGVYTDTTGLDGASPGVYQLAPSIDGASSIFSDVDAFAPTGTFNGIYWFTGAADGTQEVRIFLGSTGQFLTDFAADGSTSFPGPIHVGGDVIDNVPAVGISNHEDAIIIAALGASNQSAALTDTLAFDGSGNGIYFFTNAADGEQVVQIYLGPTGEYAWQLGADGSTSFPGSIHVSAARGIVGESTQTVEITDTAAIDGTHNALIWNGGSADGAQYIYLQLGSTGQFEWDFKADGSTALPGPIVAPNIPTSDPAVAGSIYSVAGTLHISAGP